VTFVEENVKHLQLLNPNQVSIWAFLLNSAPKLSGVIQKVIYRSEILARVPDEALLWPPPFRFSH
jgi:hypothetical protein